MTAVARFEVIPTREATMSDAVARAVTALDEIEVSYETTPTDTIVEADDADEVFAAVAAAHRAVDADRLVTSLEVDDDRTRTREGRQRVESVERRLGRPARRERRRRRRTAAGQQPQSGQQARGESTTNRTERYGGPRQREDAPRSSTDRDPPATRGE